MKVTAALRNTQGSGASRRLRHAGKVPGIVYGGEAKPVNIEIEHNPLWHALQKEAFHSSILDLDIEGKVEKVLLRDFQSHAYKPQILHIDFQRVDSTQKIHVRVPLHFHGEENSPAVKISGGLISHVITELDISCLPADLPEFISVDLSGLEVGKSIHASNIVLPAGVTTVSQEDPVIVTVVVKGGGAETTEAAK
ncbi:MAG: 50S ribosomal protein L25/general stress protein Ctc [Burkholderiales bacterium]|nr:50S ribosomal protein L25/general stress protein Ctc [Burkholderiales bacterium]